MKKHNTVKCIVICAVMVALSTVVGLFPLSSPFPYGGSITIGSLVPLILTAYLLGPKWGIMSAFCYSLIQLALGVGEVAGWGLSAGVFVGCLLLDYVLAYTSVAVAAFFRKGKPWTIVPAAICACFARFVCHFISGALFFGMWAQDGFDSITWALVYNGGYMLPEGIICAVICAALIPFIPMFRKAVSSDVK